MKLYYDICVHAWMELELKSFYTLNDILTNFFIARIQLRLVWLFFCLVAIEIWLEIGPDGNFRDKNLSQFPCNLLPLPDVGHLPPFTCYHVFYLPWASYYLFPADSWPSFLSHRESVPAFHLLVILICLAGKSKLKTKSAPANYFK